MERLHTTEVLRALSTVMYLMEIEGQLFESINGHIVDFKVTMNSDMGEDRELYEALDNMAYRIKKHIERLEEESEPTESYKQMRTEQERRFQERNKLGTSKAFVQQPLSYPIGNGKYYILRENKEDNQND